MFKENYSRLCQYAYIYLNDKEGCEDVVSEAFGYLWERYASMKEEDMLPILVQQVKHRCINNLRHNKVVEKYETFMSETTEIWEELEDDNEKINRIGKVMDSMPLQTRRVLEECYFRFIVN